MRRFHPFQPEDLQELDDRLLSLADRVVPMLSISHGDIGRRVIGLRHDVDDNEGSLLAAYRLAHWEAERGYRSTYFLLHSASYWGSEMLGIASEMEALGHEIGIHVNAIATALRTGASPGILLASSIEYLRDAGIIVRGAVAHGDELCYVPGTKELLFVNDEIFEECPRPEVGEPRRSVSADGRTIEIRPEPLAEFGLEYEANRLPRREYLSDSGGIWSQNFDDVVGRFGQTQLHMLIHPDWWTEAFVTEEATL